MVTTKNDFMWCPDSLILITVYYMHEVQKRESWKRQRLDFIMMTLYPSVSA